MMLFLYDRNNITPTYSSFAITSSSNETDDTITIKKNFGKAK